jgi:hypothetical protein
MPEIERRKCPKHFQDRLTAATGLNRYGEPNFLIAWGQSFTYKAGGVWSHDHYFGYRDLPLSNSSPSMKGQPCWMILEWHPPEDYELPEIYYFRNRDEVTGLQTLGEYPYKGRYEVAFKLISHEYRNGRLELQYYHLDEMIMNVLIPAIVEGQKMTLRERLQRLRASEEKQDKAQDQQIEDLLRASKRKLLPSQIDDRVRLIQRQMGQMLKTFGRVQPGFKLNDMRS